MNSCEFDALIVRLPGKMAWPVCYVPEIFTTDCGTKGRINAKATINGSEFPITLLPSSRGHYFVYNKEIRQHCQQDLGATVHVTLSQDAAPRELLVPEDVQVALAADADVATRFSTLPYYLRREEINKINSAKTQPTREKRIAALLARLQG